LGVVPFRWGTINKGTGAESWEAWNHVQLSRENEKDKGGVAGEVNEERRRNRIGRSHVFLFFKSI